VIEFAPQIEELPASLLLLVAEMEEEGVAQLSCEAQVKDGEQGQPS